MCGRFSFFVPTGPAEERFDATAVVPLAPRYNFAPGDDVYTITNDHPDAIDAHHWGFTPPWDDTTHLINARAETVAENRVFKASFERHRCLILADGYYEWQGTRGAKRPHRIQLASGEPFAFAGLWQSTESAEPSREVTIITTDANETVQPIHDRMPVILNRRDEDRWLTTTDVSEALGVLTAYRDAPLEAYEISTMVNDPSNDSPELIEPLQAGSQSSLGEF